MCNKTFRGVVESESGVGDTPSYGGDDLRFPTYCLWRTTVHALKLSDLASRLSFKL